MNAKKINMILYVCLFFSGIAGLVYEVLWARYLSMIFGNTAYAHTLVLATFMGGLALGSFFLGGLADKVKDRLAFYGWVEIGIAVFCIFTPDLFAFAKTIYLSAAKMYGLGHFGITAVKFAIGAVIILPPTILMGGTIPILSKYVIRTHSIRGEGVARLYYINSFGAVTGTVLAGFYFIRTFGLEFSVNIAALTNMAVGAAVIVLKNIYKGSAFLNVPDEYAAESYKETPEEGGELEKGTVKLAVFGIFLSGFIAMLYEIVWIRLLSTILGSSTYSFSLMLAAFIAGITIGALIVSRKMPGSRNAFLLFGVSELLIGISLVMVIPVYEKLPLVFVNLSGIFSRKEETFFFYSLIEFLIAFFVMLPATVFLGMTLPLVSKIASRRMRVLGKDIGAVFASNTLGNILGALVTGLVIMPFLGVKNTLELGIIMNIILGAVLICFVRKVSPRIKKAAIFSAVGAILFLKVAVPDWDNVNFSAQLFRYDASKIDTREYFQQLKKKKILFYKDGIDSTVSVIELGGKIGLYINGKADASTSMDMPTQMLCAHLPLLLRPGSEDVLVVGLGSGITCGSALQHPIKKLDVIEISGTVVEASRLFDEYNYKALENERLDLYVEDARTFVERIDKKYDIIINEPSNPWMSGIGALFSVEYFRDCSRLLKPDGLMLQWVQGYDMNSATFETVLRTFNTVFPEVMVWGTGVKDLLLIGSSEPIKIDLAESERRFGEKTVKEDLEKIGLRDLFTLLSLQLSSPGTTRDFVKLTRAVNGDFFPTLEYDAPLALYTKAEIAGEVERLDERNLPLEKGGLVLREYLQTREISGEGLENMYDYMSVNPTYNERLLFAVAKAWKEKSPEEREAVTAYAVKNSEAREKAISIFEGIVLSGGEDKYLEQYAGLLVERYFAERSFLFPGILQETIEKLDKCVELAGPRKAMYYHARGKVYEKSLDYANAARSYIEAEKALAMGEDPGKEKMDRIALLNDISYAALLYGAYPEAHEYARKVLAEDKDNPTARIVTGTIERLVKEAYGQRVPRR